MQHDGQADNLNAAYQRGYFVGLTGKGLDQCPHPEADILSAAWEAGWHDGFEAVQARSRPIARQRAS
ncbi:ribosome modulation factor [Salinispirillum marinum]|uniref:Ribosome modulation factor n=2 Tax=Saccharospirillaceae TaxID=255527 RepID=A0ABV8BEI3_9GAMM